MKSDSALRAGLNARMGNIRRVATSAPWRPKPRRPTNRNVTRSHDVVRARTSLTGFCMEIVSSALGKYRAKTPVPAVTYRTCHICSHRHRRRLCSSLNAVLDRSTTSARRKRSVRHAPRAKRSVGGHRTPTMYRRGFPCGTVRAANKVMAWPYETHPHGKHSLPISTD